LPIAPASCLPAPSFAAQTQPGPYGDYQPKAAYRWLADLEAVFGAALLATFVVCLTRKYMR